MDNNPFRSSNTSNIFQVQQNQQQQQQQSQQPQQQQQQQQPFYHATTTHQTGYPSFSNNSVTHFNQTSGTMTGHQPWSTASISHFDPLQSNSTSLYQQSHPQHSSYYSPGQNPPPQFLPSQQQQQQGLLNMQPTQNLETISAHTGYNTYANSNLQGNFYIPPTFGTDLTQQQFQQPQQTQQTYQNYQQPQPLQQQQHQPIYRHAPVDAASLLKSREVRRVECPVCHKTIEGDDPAINYHVNEHYS